MILSEGNPVAAIKGGPNIHPPAAVLCDLDNTLLDLSKAKHAACDAVAIRVGAGTGDTLISYFILGFHGYEGHENIRDFMKDFGVYEEEAYLDACRIYEDVKLDTVTAFEGVRDTLNTIRKSGISLGIITDADTLHATSRLDRIGVLQMVDCLITPDRAGARKPDPRGFVLATETLEVSPESVCVVGDSLRREIEPAKRLGMTTVYARYGDRSNTNSPVVPDYTIMAFPELLPILGLQGK